MTEYDRRASACECEHSRAEVMVMAPRRVSLREIRRRAEQIDERARRERETAARPPPPRFVPEPRRTVPGRDDYTPHRSGMGPVLEIPSEERCRYCQAEGVRVWEEKPMQSPWLIAMFLVASVLSAGVLLLPAAVVWLIMINRTHYHWYCPTCGAIWVSTRREQSS